MPGTINAHRLLRGTTLASGYLQILNVSAEKQEQLRTARDIVRQALRDGLREVQKIAVAKGLVENRYIALATSLPPLQPRFRMQGSGAYHTMNHPAHVPPQEIDYDDGLYLPTSFVSANGSTKPVIAAKGIFRAVEEILEPVCAKNGWTLNRKKSRCVRIEIASDAHIDMPLYAIPDREFTTLTEAARALVQKAGARQLDEDFALSEIVYKQLPADRIMLAQRDNGWIESDPRKIEKWLQAAIDDHGEALRYVCRYFKGWRDYQWKECCLSSLAIMACVVSAYDELGGTLPDDRDDTAILIVSRKLSDLLSKRIPNPVITDQRLDEDWTPDGRANLVRLALQMHAELDAALNDTFHKGVAIGKMRALFGPRIPNDETLLRVDTAERQVLSYQPAQVAAPIVHRSTSG